MKTLDDLHVAVAAKLGLCSAAYESLFAAGPVDGDDGRSVAAALREQHGVSCWERLDEGLFARGALSWLEARALGEYDLAHFDGDLAGLVNDAFAAGARSVGVGRFDYPSAADVKDEAERAEAAAALETLVTHYVLAVLSEDGLDTTELEVRLNELEPGEIRLYF